MKQYLYTSLVVAVFCNLPVFAQTSTNEVDLSSVVKHGAWLVKDTKNQYYAPEAETREFEQAYERFKAASTRTNTDSGKLQALDEYKRALRKFEKKTSDSRTQLFGFKLRNSTTHNIASNIGRVDKSSRIIEAGGYAPDTSVKFADSSLKNCATYVFGCAENPDGTFSPRIKRAPTTAETTAATTVLAAAPTTNRANPGGLVPVKTASKATIEAALGPNVPDAADVAEIDRRNPFSETTSTAAAAQNPRPAGRPLTTATAGSDTTTAAATKTAKQLRDETTAAVPRCLYSGFLGKNEGPKNKCSPIRSTKQAKDLGIKLNGVKDFDCKDGAVMCNPLVFGVTESLRPHCVKETKKASNDCAKVSNMADAKAKERYKKLLEDPMNQASRAALVARVKRACSPEKMIEDAEHTENITNRKDKKDHLQTCQVLQVAIETSKNVEAIETSAEDRRTDSQLLQDKQAAELLNDGVQ